MSLNRTFPTTAADVGTLRPSSKNQPHTPQKHTQKKKNTTELDEITPTFAMTVFELAASWRRKVVAAEAAVARTAGQPKDGGLVLNIFEEVSKCTFDIIGRTAFGYDFHEIKDHNSALGAAFKAAVDNTRLLASKHSILTVVHAGHEATSTALTSALIHLAEHSAVQTSLHAEVAAALPTSNPLVLSYDLAHSLHYVDAVVKETIRFIHTLPFLYRHAAEVDEIQGYKIKVLGGDDAHSFNPDRFEQITTTREREGAGE
ncbi:cytochrome P450 [Zopfochytrium polystomum]|nr:cytochrome P450 [Zopfochytrium polystomum]